VNYFSAYTWIKNDSFMESLTSWPMPFWLVLLTEYEVLHCHALNAVYRCLVAGQWYPSCGFSSADCRCFSVSNPCRAIHWMLSVHHTALSDKYFNHNDSFLWKFHDFVQFLLICRSWQFHEVK